MASVCLAMISDIQVSADDQAIFREDALDAAGFDTERGKSFCGGDGGHYLRALQLFAQRRGGDAIRARAALAADKRAEAARELHSLGVELSLLGAEEASEVAIAVEWALRNGGPVQPGLDHLDEILRNACAAIASTCTEAGLPENGTADPSADTRKTQLKVRRPQ
jgi:HPt (histidine-containing phosphotransfer) domain-containing protein